MSALHAAAPRLVKDVSEGQREATRRRVAWRPLLMALIAVALAVGAGWWWTHPRELDSAYGASAAADPRPFRPGVVWRAELTVPGHFPDEGVLTLRSVEVGLERAHQTDATVEVFRCTPVGTDDGGFLSVGFGDERPAAEFGCVPAVDGTRMDADDHLVAVLTPDGPGKYVIKSATVTYQLDASGLWRRGTESTRLNAAATYS